MLAGGRGLGHFDNGFKSGVHLVNSYDGGGGSGSDAGSSAEAKEIASKMLGHNLITKQTGAEGRPCNRVLVVEQTIPVQEKYFALLYDRASQVGCSGPVACG